MAFFDSAFGILVEGTLKGSLILAAAALLVLALRRASAAYRHVIWVCAFGAALALPILLSLPAWRISAPALAWLQPMSRTQTRVIEGLSRAPVRARQENIEPTAPPSNATLEPFDGSQAQSLSPSAEPRHVSWPAIALTVWALGALGVLLSFLVGHRELRRLLRNAEPVEDGEWSALATEAAERLNIKTPFALLRGEGLPVPVAVGLLRPRVLLPSGSDSWPLELRRAVLLHELAHVQRHDCLTQAVAQITCALFWFHPAFWWAASRMRAERERACDDCVLSARTKATEYAEHLLGVVRSLRGGGLEAMGTVAFARPSSLEGRLLSVLDPVRDRRAVGRRAGVLALVGAALLVVPLAIIEPVQAYSVHVQSKNGVQHEVSDPKALLPADVIAVPEAHSLEAGAAWARSSAERGGQKEYWIGWRLDTSPGLKGNLLSDTEGISLWVLEQHGFFTLEDVLTGSKRGTWNTESAPNDEGKPRPAAMLVRVRGGKIDRFRVQSLSLPADFGGQPFYWMDQVPEEQMVAWLRESASTTRDEDMRRQYVECLGFMKRSDLVVPLLRQALEGMDTERVRAGAAEGLGHQPSPEVVGLLASHARKDRSSEVRRASVEALGQLQTAQALEELLKIAHAGEADAVARRAAYDALGQKVSERAQEESRSEAVHAAGKAKSYAWKVEEGDANEEDSKDEPSMPMAEGDFEVQRQAIEALGRYPEAQSLPRLKRIAETSPNADLRAQAVESIGRLGTTNSLEIVEKIAWENRMEDARRSAVEALGRNLLGDQALEKLARIARTHPSQETRRTAIEMVGRMDSPKAVALLREVVAKGDGEDVQRQAVESLGRRDDPGVESTLLEIAHTHRSVDVRRQAVESLGRRDGKQVVSELLELAKRDGPEDVQRQAVESLGRLDADVMSQLEGIARSHPSSSVRHQAVESMMRRDPDQALKVIEEILREPKKTGT